MDRCCISTTRAPSAIGPYSQGLRVGQWIFVSGQIPLHPDTGELLMDIKEATGQCLDNVRAVLEAGGTSMAEVVKITVYLCNMADFAAMNDVYRTYFPNCPPARAVVQVAGLPRNANIEIEAVAVAAP